MIHVAVFPFREPRGTKDGGCFMPANGFRPMFICVLAAANSDISSKAFSARFWKPMVAGLVVGRAIDSIDTVVRQRCSHDKRSVNRGHQKKRRERKLLH